MKTLYWGMLGALVLTASQAISAEEFPCRAPSPYGKLDFMLGDWSIVVNDKAVAWIKLEKDGQGCLIREQYGVPGYDHSGAGIDYWDAAAAMWRRILVTSVGTIETFEGRWLNDGAFVWEGREQRLDGSVVPERVVIRRDGDDVLNDIYQSEDNGETWILRASERRIRRTASEPGEPLPSTDTR